MSTSQHQTPESQAAAEATYQADLMAGMNPAQQQAYALLGEMHIDVVAKIASAGIDLRGEAIRRLGSRGKNAAGTWVGAKQTPAQVHANIAALNIAA